jgi:hypothetical protein
MTEAQGEGGPARQMESGQTGTRSELLQKA